jgi:hypothetical protein
MNLIRPLPWISDFNSKTLSNDDCQLLIRSENFRIGRFVNGGKQVEKSL